MWLGPVNSFSPYGAGFIEWDALWMEEAPGVSLDLLSFSKAPVVGTNGTAQVDRKDLEELLFTK